MLSGADGEAVALREGFTRRGGSFTARCPPASSFCFPPCLAPSSPRGSGAAGPWCSRAARGCPARPAPCPLLRCPDLAPCRGEGSLVAVTQPAHASVPRTPPLTPGRRPDGRGRRLPAPTALPRAEATPARAAGSFPWAARHDQLVPPSWPGQGEAGWAPCQLRDRNIPFGKLPDVVLGWGQGTPNPWVAGKRGCRWDPWLGQGGARPCVVGRAQGQHRRAEGWGDGRVGTVMAGWAAGRWPGEPRGSRVLSWLCMSCPFPASWGPRVGQGCAQHRRCPAAPCTPGVGGFPWPQIRGEVLTGVGWQRSRGTPGMGRGR